jgi:DNA polymerase
VSLFTIDFETYYDKEYSLKEMSTEDYIADPRFEVILVGIKKDNAAPYYIHGKRQLIEQHLKDLRIEDHAVLAHNMSFDGMILSEIFGIVPKMYMDTRLMAQARIKPYSRSVSLDACLKHFEGMNLGVKGDEVKNMLGRTAASLSRTEMQGYAAYCMNDCETTYQLFRQMAAGYPRSELEIIDMTLRMYLAPRLRLDETLLAEILHEARAKKEQLLAQLPANVTKADLMSNPKFAALLQARGVEVPQKTSPTTGQITWALAKTDTGWKQLEEDYGDDPEVAPLLLARISAKSTIEETRLERLLEIALHKRYFRIPLLYYAAHTGRYGGTDGINVQNFPRVDKSRMRYAVVAPKDHKMVAADLAQIEARITAWLAGETKLVLGFRNAEDVYSNFAATAFRVSTQKGRSKEDDRRRFIGKTCILGLGFGMSDVRLRATLRAAGVKMELNECMNLVNVYRTMYSAIPRLWRKLDEMIPLLAGAGTATLGPVVFSPGKVSLPNGMELVYPNLRYVQSEDYAGWMYDFAGEARTLWGGKLCENIVQALARIIVMEHMLTIKHTLKLSPSLQVHDELDYVVPEQYADKVARAIGKMMAVSPAWALDLPVAVEVNVGDTFGDCK